MRKFIGKSNERILCKLSKSEILRLYSIVHVAMETTKTSHFTCRSKSIISIFFTCQVSACELRRFFCHDLTNDIYSQTAKTVFSHLKNMCERSWRYELYPIARKKDLLNTYQGALGRCFINILVPFNNTEQIKVANLPCMDIAVWSERTRSS